MDWIKSWMPTWQFAETHHLRSRASARALLDAAQAYRPDDDWLVGVAMALREAPGRLAAAVGLPSTLAERPRFGKDDFLPLGRLGDEALAYGLVGKFWQPGYGLVKLADAQAFQDFADPGIAKLLLGFEARADGDATRITTVSRLVCTDAATRQRMAVYWGLIRPVSGLIRQRLLAQIRRDAEAV